MEMEVRHFLAAVDTVVLESEDSQRLIGTDQRDGQSPGGTDDLFSLFVTEIQQCWGMPPGNDAALSDLVLIRVDDRDRMFAFIDESPGGVSSCKSLANLTWLLIREFNHR